MPGPHTAFTKVPAPGTGLLVRRVDDTGAVRMVLTGELSIATADDVREAIQREQRNARHVICDLTEISFIDVPGVCMLIDLAARAPTPVTGSPWPIRRESSAASCASSGSPRSW